MKKTITLFMALALVTSLFAVPQNPKLQKKGDTAVKPAAELNIARQVAHKASMAKKNISRNAVRKAPMDGATTFTFASAADLTQSKNGIKVVFATASGSTDPTYNTTWNQLRVYANNTIKVSGSKITKVELTCSKQGKKDYLDMTANTGVLVSGGTSTDSTDLKVDTWTGDAASVTFTLGSTGQRIVKKIVVTGEGGSGSDTITLNTMAYASAYYSEGYWDFDLYVDYDEETGLTYPEFYFMCDEEATSGTAISGEWTMYYAGVWYNDNDSAEMADGYMNVTVNADKTYNFYGQFTGDDDNVYIIDLDYVEVYAYDADNYYEEIELDEEGGGSTVDTIVIPVNDLQAVRLDEYSTAGAYLWEFDAMNVSSLTQYENLWFYIYTPHNNRLEGIYDIESDNIYNYWGSYYAGYITVDGNDTTSVSAGAENIQLMIAYDETSKAYDVVGELLSENGKKLYQFEVEDFYIASFNEEQEDIVLVDSTEFIPDTIDITGQDAIEFAYYASYSEEGAHNYSINLYSIANDYPYLALDIYTAAKDEFVGVYDTATNVGEYCTFYTIDETEIGVVNPVFSISKNGDVYTIAGSFTGADQNFYRFSVSAEATMADGDHPYEPMDKQADIHIVANSMDLVTDYVSDYNELDIYLNGANDTIQLALVTSKTTIANGTYAISTAEEPANGEMIAGYYSFLGLGGCVAYVGDDVYYLTDGSLVVATANDTVTYTLNATSVHGTVVTAVYKEYKAGPQPTGDHTIVFADYCSAEADTAFTTTDGIYSVIARKGTNTSTGPKYLADSKDLRTYAGNTFSLTATSHMTQIVFNISTQGLKRQAEITPTTGVMAYDMTAATVTWTGDAANVVFTVGAKNKYGSDETTKAGQFDFTSLDITLKSTGLMEASEVNIPNSKFIMDGKLFILKNGILYNAQGQVVK